MSTALLKRTDIVAAPSGREVISLLKKDSAVQVAGSGRAKKFGQESPQGFDFLFVRYGSIFPIEKSVLLPAT
jgi:hypothetical protein